MYMGYRLENKEIDLFNRRTSKISTSKSGDIYKYRGQAIKVYPNNIDFNEVLDENTARYLTGITTDRILLPRKLLFYNRNFVGYSLKLVDKKGSNGRIINAPVNDVIFNIELLEEDIDLLSSKGILLNGITPNNVIYNGDIYLTDPSRYAVMDGGDTRYLNRLNQYQLHLLISELIVSDIRKDNFRNSTVSNMRELFSLKDDNERCGEFFEELFEGNKSIKQFVKKQ